MDAAAIGYHRSSSVTLTNGADAAQSLPDYRELDEILNGRQSPTQPGSKNGSGTQKTRDSMNFAKQRAPLAGGIYPERTTPAATDEIYRQMEELDRHRRTAHELSDKIIALNNKRVELERENADLRRQLDNYLYTAKPSFLGDDEVLLDQTELSRRYAIIKGKLKRQAGDLKEYKDKVLQLQKLLIEKNEEQKEFLRRNGIGRTQINEREQLDRQLQAKKEQFNSLEELHRKQQRLIDKLERLLDSRNNKDSHEQQITEVLREENRLLRLQLNALMVRLASEQRNAVKNRTTDDELQRFQQQLDVATERIKSLEKQLEENAKKWSRERADLRLRAQISGLGLNNPSPFPYRLTPLPTLGTRSADRDNYAGHDFTRPSKRHQSDDSYY